MKIYLAGPMSGRPNHNFPSFNTAADQLRAAGHEVFNPAEVDHGKPPENVAYREALAIDLTRICEHADAIALLPGWRDSRGVQAELALARALGIDTGLVEDFL